MAEVFGLANSMPRPLLKPFLGTRSDRACGWIGPSRIRFWLALSDIHPSTLAEAVPPLKISPGHPQTEHLALPWIRSGVTGLMTRPQPWIHEVLS